MGEKLVKYYKMVEEKGGLQAKTRLAMRTNISSPKAAEAPDSPENLEKFFQAVKEILGTTPPRL